MNDVACKTDIYIYIYTDQAFDVVTSRTTVYREEGPSTKYT